MPPKRSLLVVDDGARHSALLERGLRAASPGAGIVVMPEGERALEHLALCGTRRPMPDLILMDRQMPQGVGGFEAIRLIRELAHLREVPILMVSGSDDADHVAQARHVGADGYFPKPGQEDGYPAFATRLIAWRLAQSWRTPPAQLSEHGSSTALALPDSQGELVPVSSRAMHALSALPPAPAPGLLQTFVANLAAYFPALAAADPAGVNGVFVDQDEVDITFAERQARIRRAQVEDLKRHNDQDSDRKRQKFFRVLFERGWTVPQVMERFPLFGLTYFKRLRGKAHKSRTDRALPG